MAEGSALLLKKQLKELSKSPHEYFSCGLVDDNIYEWDILIIPPAGTMYEGGFLKARMSFPKNFPEMPPLLRFTSDMWHPNSVLMRTHLIRSLIYPDGIVCISILHPPGDDKYGYEHASERWLPVHTVETIMLSVISMLSDPNDQSPANVDAAKEWRDSFDAFKKRVGRLVRRSAENF